MGRIPPATGKVNVITFARNLVANVTMYHMQSSLLKNASDDVYAPSCSGPSYLWIIYDKNNHGDPPDNYPRRLGSQSAAVARRRTPPAYGTLVTGHYNP